MTDYWLRRRLSIATLLGLFILSIHSLPALAEIVEAKLPTGIIAAADFRTGKSSRPAIITISGFLQNRESPPMSSLANTLLDHGYTVLSPTLSLGIHHRIKSLGCEAAHTHTKDDGIAEINFWTNWLTHKGYHRVILIGHSSGGLQILQYLTQKPNPAIKQAILVSPVTLRTNPQEAQTTAARLKSGQISGKELKHFTLGYCNTNYVSLPAAYLSYVADDNKILSQFDKAKVPVEAILGAADTAMPPDWPEKIRAHGSLVTVVTGANHFFDGPQEFDLADKVVSILNTLPAGTK